MNKDTIKILKRNKRRRKIRAKIIGTKNRPRLSVFKSNKGLFLQLINDDNGKTLASASSKEVKVDSKDNKKLSGKVGISYELGKIISNKAQKLKIKQAVFNRGGYKFHGRIKAVVDGAREGGLKI